MEEHQEESLEHTPDQQQHQQQQQTTVEKESSPFLSPTTPAWGDRNLNEQSTEETNNNFSFLFANSVSNTSDLRVSPSSQSSSKNNNLIENNQSSIDATRLPRKCKLCPYIATERTEYVDHIITHCTFKKSTYIGHDYLINEHVEDEDLDDYSTESQSKGKKKPKNPKPKLCSKCDFVAKTKLVLWLHLRQHFVQEDSSGFVCTLCLFATTLKHHMTFHWFSAHDDFKAYICKECQYSCVSKSMLTSHLKTHSEVYQYNCKSCTYKTKFCNAMKKHLKDTLHISGPVLNPDGTPNPFATIDVYGNKRGPRRKPLEKELIETVEDRLSFDRSLTSGIISPTLTVPTSSASVLSPISSTAILDSPDSKNPVALMSPVRMSPVRMSPVRMSPVRMSPVRMSPINISPVRTSSTPVPTSRSCSLVKDILTQMLRSGMNLNSNPKTAKEQIPILNPIFEHDPILIHLCQMMMQEIQTRGDKEQGQAFHILKNAQKFLPSFNSKHSDQTVLDSVLGGDLSDKTIEKSTTSMTIDEPSTSTTLSSELQKMEVEENGHPDEPLDLSMSAMKTENQPECQPKESASFTSRRSKRKRKATKLEYFTINDCTNDDETQTLNTNQTCTEPSLPALLTTSQSDLQTKNETFNVTHNANIYNSPFICYYCRIIFANEIMYAVHMSFHNATNPLICALCDRKSANTTAFFLHLIRTKH